MPADAARVRNAADPGEAGPMAQRREPSQRSVSSAVMPGVV